MRQVKRLLAEIQRLTGALDASRQHTGPTRQQMDRLQSAINTKDEKLRLLRDAFKTLEV